MEGRIIYELKYDREELCSVLDIKEEHIKNMRINYYGDLVIEMDEPIQK